MARISKEDLSKLPLTERIKKLKEIEKESKKDIEDAEKLIKDTKEEIRTSEIASDIAPEPERVEISSLFKAEESLEGTVGGRGPREEEKPADYTATQDYVPSETPRREAAARLEEREKYKTTSKDAADKSVASKSVLEDSKKYSKG